MKPQDFLYKKLARDFEAKIERGELKSGEKLPSLRQMQKKLGCSLSTVYQAYMDLEANHLVEARPKSGFIVKSAGSGSAPLPLHNRTIFKPGPVQLSAITSDVVNASLDPDLIPLGASVISQELLPIKHLNRIIRDILAEDPGIALSYSPPEGTEELRRLLAGRLTGLLPNLYSDDLLITNGCMEAVALALNLLLKPGDVVAVESPTHFGFLHLLHRIGAQVVGIPTDPQDGIVPESLELILDNYHVKACLLIPNFHNPLGAIIPEENKKEIIRLTSKKNIPIIEDDIYGELFFGERRPSLFKQLDEKDLVITCSSASKVLASGYRIGWCMPGQRFKEKIFQLKAAYSLCAPTLQQHVMSHYLASGGYDRYLRTLRTRLQHQLTDTAAAVQRYFPETTRLTMPKGGNMLWVELPGGVDGVQLYHHALQKGVSIVPGQAFSVTGEYKNFIRISATSPLSSQIKEGLQTLGQLTYQLLETHQ